MIYFVSGHRDLSYEDFKEYYIPTIKEVIDKDKNAKFIVGDCEGVDKFAMDFIYQHTNRPLTVFHMFGSPRNTPFDLDNHKLDKFREVCFIGGFNSDIDRDSTMTNLSDIDIAFIKDNRWNSGTAQNIKRRYKFKKD